MKILALFGTGNKGKTETLNLLIDELTEQDRKNIKEEIKYGKDRCCILEHNDKILKITTRGDNEYCLNCDYNLFPKYKNKVDVFICAARSKGETHKYITEKLEADEVFWLSKATFFNTVKGQPECSEDVENYRNTQNETQAKEMLAILDDFLLRRFLS